MGYNSVSDNRCCLPKSRNLA